jgi:hypothetical protein
MTNNYLAVIPRTFKGFKSWATDDQLKMLEQELSEEARIVHQHARAMAHSRNGLSQVKAEIVRRGL